MEADSGALDMVLDHIPEPIVEEAAPIEHQPLDDAFRHGIIGIGDRQADRGSSKGRDDLGGKAGCPDLHAPAGPIVC